MEEYNFGKMIRCRLKEVGMQQLELAERLGVNKNTVTNMLYSKDISAARLVEVSKALRYNFFADIAKDMDIDEIINYKQTKEI